MPTRSPSGWRECTIASKTPNGVTASLWATQQQQQQQQGDGAAPIVVDLRGDAAAGAPDAEGVVAVVRADDAAGEEAPSVAPRVEVPEHTTNIPPAAEEALAVAPPVEVPAEASEPAASSDGAGAEVRSAQIEVRWSRAPSIDPRPKVCGKCKQAVNPLVPGVRLVNKTAEIWECPGCNVKEVVMTRWCGSWPTEDVAGLSEKMQEASWQTTGGSEAYKANE